MSNILLQRTLLVGLGEVGARTTDLLLTELIKLWGEVGFIQGIAVLANAVNLEQVALPLLVSPEAEFETWQTEFAGRVELALNDISQLNNLTKLSQQGINLYRPDEVYVIVITDLAEIWVSEVLAGITEALRQTIYRTLAGQASLAGILLFVPPAETKSGDESTAFPTSIPERSIDALPTDDLPIKDFDRGCFLASLTNEAGLVVGDTGRLIHHAVRFLSLLVRNTPVGELDWAENDRIGWAPHLTSFGIATIRWPGSELVEILSTRWSQAMLKQMLTLPQDKGSTGDLTQQAREAVHQWLTGQKLAPPLLIDRLGALMPPIPNHLSVLVPDPPWPWLMMGTQARIESAAQRWQDDWLATAKETFSVTLAELQAGWYLQAESWLAQQLALTRPGSVLIAQSYLATVSEFLQAFVEGVEQKLEDAEADLASLDRQLGQAAETLAIELATFPTSPLSTFFHWGRRPLRWLRYWTRCQRAQKFAHNFAHLSRGRLIAWQTIWYYEEILPFYRQCLADWHSLTEVWEQTCRQVFKASAAPTLTDWAGQLERCLLASEGPWTETLVTVLFQETLEIHTNTVWEQAGTLSDWMTEAIEAEALTRRLRDQTAQHLAQLVVMPADQALCRQLPDEKAQTDWLMALIEQARPFWPYDETKLAESSRARARLQTWLLLPGGEVSPLAHLGQGWSHSPVLLSSHHPEELGVVTVRRMNWGEGEIELNS